jgi:hypothetical protein
MNAEAAIRHGNQYPFDASDEWWNGSGDDPPKAKSWAHSVARGIIADLQDRHTVGDALGGIDEETRVEIIETMTGIIRLGYEQSRC